MQSSQEFLKKVEDAAKAEIADEDFRKSSKCLHRLSPSLKGEQQHDSGLN